jgi:hypothetical protein
MLTSQLINHKRMGMLVRKVLVLFSLFFISINIFSSDDFRLQLAREKHSFLPGAEIIYNECLGGFEDLFKNPDFIQNDGKKYKKLKSEEFIRSHIDRLVEGKSLSKYCSELYEKDSKEKKNEFTCFCLNYFGDINLRLSFKTTSEKWHDLHRRFKCVNFYSEEDPWVQSVSNPSLCRVKRGTKRRVRGVIEEEAVLDNVKDDCVVSSTNPYARSYSSKRRKKIQQLKDDPREITTRIEGSDVSLFCDEDLGNDW